MKRRTLDEYGKSMTIDMTGFKKGQFEIIRLATRDEMAIESQRIKLGARSGAYWIALCSCGNEFIVSRGNALRNSVISCGCSGRRGLRKSKFDGCVPNERARFGLFRKYASNAKSRGIEWGLTYGQFCWLTSRYCAYCRSGPNRHAESFKKNGHQPSYPYNGIDRVDSDAGYTPENCVPCCRTCNVTKNDMSLEQFREWIKLSYFMWASGDDSASHMVEMFGLPKDGSGLAGLEDKDVSRMDSRDLLARYLGNTYRESSK